jgi:DNA-binding MarR family transcriptional regulator
MGKLPRRDIANVDELKALAHPLRQRMLYQLAFAGSSTATSLAQALGENTGSTSYHLRQLERFGFIEQDPDRPSRRERWWRLVPLDLRAVKGKAAKSGAAGELGRMRLQRDRDLVDRYLRNRHRLPAAAAMFSSSATHLTAEEMVRFTEEYVALLSKWWRPQSERPPDAIPVAALFYTFPWPGEDAGRGGAR